jgi:hypothetical protein
MSRKFAYLWGLCDSQCQQRLVSFEWQTPFEFRRKIIHSSSPCFLSFNCTFISVSLLSLTDTILNIIISRSKLLKSLTLFQSDSKITTFYILLPVHLFMILGKWPTWHTILFYVFISIFYMFRATLYSSWGESLYQYNLWYKSLCVGDRFVCWTDVLHTDGCWMFSVRRTTVRSVPANV